MVAAGSTALVIAARPATANVRTTSDESFRIGASYSDEMIMIEGEARTLP
jgi:hypothetical protein